MATSSSILEVVQHYQRSIERCQDDEERLLHCITKLYKVPIKVEHLQETGIGKTVNSLRKFNGEIGVAAKALVTKWKAMVAAEEEPMETNCTSAEDDVNPTNGRRSSDDDQFDDNRNNQTESRDPHRQEQKSTDDSHHSSKDRDKHRRKESGSSGKHTSGAEHRHESSSKSKHNSSQDHEKKSVEKHHKSRERSDKSEHRERGDKRKEEKRDKEEASTSSHHKSSSSSSKKKEENSSDGHHSSKEKSERKESKHRGESEKHSTSKDKDKHGSKKTKEENLDKIKSSSKDKEHQAKDKPSNSKHHATTSTSHTSSSTSTSERKRSHHTVEESVETKSPNAKIAKVQKVPNNNNNNNNNGEAGTGDDGIDSSMGANFADVLGMLNIPTKKSKKSLANTSKSPVAAASTSASTSKENSNKSLNNSKMNGSKLFSSPAAVTTSTYSPDVKPLLLSSTAKLEPLDPNIALELPHITNNYKPLPRNQTVMDCVFNTNTSSASTRPVRTLTDAEAYSHGISSKTMRTKIYSGVRTGQILQVPSLFDLCIRVLQKNIDALEYTGGVPFEVLRSVLERATPHQLLVFEEYNPYLMEDSDELWQLHVQRTYRAHKRQEMESWREMFLRCQEDQERKLSILAESIKQSQKIIAAPVRKTQLAFVDSMVKPPRNVQRKQEQYGTKSKLIATPAARVASLSSVTPNAAKSGDTRLRIAAACARDPAQVSNSALRQKKAPLMAKTLQFMRRKR